jgi:hypothetical protein
MKLQWPIMFKTHTTTARDTMQNEIMRLGNNSKSAHSEFTSDLHFTRNWVQLNALWRSHWLTQRIVGKAANDMTREWVEIQSEIDPKQIKAIQQFEKQIRFKKKLNLALKWARLHGGCLLFMDFGPQSDPSKPIFPNQVKQGGLKAIHVLERWRLTPSGGLVENMSSHDFGLPRQYIFENQTIHHSRVIRIVPGELPWIEQYRENHWGASILEPVFNVVRKYEGISDAGIELAFQAYIKNIGVEGLHDGIATGKRDAIYQTYIGLTEMANNNRFFLRDKNDELDTKTYTFAGYSDMMQMYMTELCGATEYSMIQLWGDAVKGLNNTGDGDIRVYYDTIKSKQEAELRAPMDKAYSFIVPSVLGSMPADFDYDFKNLWQISDKEASEIVYQQAQADQIYENMGVVSPKTIALELKQRGYYQNITTKNILDAVSEKDNTGKSDVPDKGNDETV